MHRYRLSDAAQADVINILAWTQQEFGDAARYGERRAGVLLPSRPGFCARSEAWQSLEPRV